jgi:hypothetical protein
MDFKVTKVYADENGDSRFEEIFFPLTDKGPIGSLSESVSVKELLFRIVPPTYDDFHNAPAKQFVILLDGGVEIETSLHEKRQFKTGEVLLMIDTKGKGHRTKNLEFAERRSLFITIE